MTMEVSAMRRSVTLGLVVLIVVGVLAAPASADPPNVEGTYEQFRWDHDCGSETIVRDISGWWGLLQDVDHVSKYHFTTVYTNADGRTWRYMNTGLFRWFESNGDSYESVTGRSENVGPGATTWIGRWVHNFDTGDVSYVGQGLGGLDEAACLRLVG
jgi:hypothetical protein